MLGVPWIGRCDAAPWARVASSVIGAARVITVDNRSVFAILPQDVDLIAGETTDSKAAETVARLQIAFDEAVELRNPSRLMRAGLMALAATVLLVGGVWLLGRLHRASSRWVRRSAERQLARLPGAETIVDTTWTPMAVGRAVTVGTVLLGLMLVDGWLMFVLRQFPYTRPAGEALRGSVLAGLLSLWRLVVDALPGLFVVLVIALLTRVVARVATLVFQAVEEGRITVPGVYPETAQPTRPNCDRALVVFALVGVVWLSAGQRLRGVSGCQRVHRTDDLAGIDRHHEPDHERFHPDLFAVAAPR